MKVSGCLVRHSFRTDVMSITRKLGSFIITLANVSTPVPYMFPSHKVVIFAFFYKLHSSLNVLGSHLQRTFRM